MALEGNATTPVPARRTMPRETYYQQRSAHLPQLGDEHARWITRHLPTAGRTLKIRTGHREISI